MHPRRALPLALVVFAAACTADDPAGPDLDELAVRAEAKDNQRKACRPTPLTPVATGTIDEGDCAFDNAGTTQYEDIYLVSQGRLGGSADGATMLTFTGDAAFDMIFGVGEMDGEISPDPVYGYTRTPGLPNRFSIAGSDAVYKMWFAGTGPDQLGDYTLTTTVEPTANVCATGHLVFLQGDVAFSSAIADDVSCQTTVQFGPNVGAPINVQYWYMKLLPGESVTLTLTGVTDPTVALFALGGGADQLDLGDGAGDGDRTVTLTAQYQTYAYLEVSSLQGTGSPYTLQVDGP